MPTLFRLLIFVATVGGLVYGGMLALANLVEPQPRDMSFTIPAERLSRDPAPR